MPLRQGCFAKIRGHESQFSTQHSMYHQGHLMSHVLTENVSLPTFGKKSRITILCYGVTTIPDEQVGLDAFVALPFQTHFSTMNVPNDFVDSHYPLCDVWKSSQRDSSWATKFGPTFRSSAIFREWTAKCFGSDFIELVLFIRLEDRRMPRNLW